MLSTQQRAASSSPLPFASIAAAQVAGFLELVPIVAAHLTCAAEFAVDLVLRHGGDGAAQSAVRGYATQT